PETRVGIHLDRSLDLVVAIVAVLKAGGAYVPLDPAYPARRLAYLVENSGARVLISREGLPDGIVHSSAEILLDRDAAGIAAEPSAAIDPGISPDNAAYIIYTSGSTGTPKGCIVTHRNV